MIKRRAVIKTFTELTSSADLMMMSLREPVSSSGCSVISVMSLINMIQMTAQPSLQEYSTTKELSIMATEMKRDHIVTSVKVQCMKKLLLGYCLYSTGSVCLIVAKMFFVKYLDQGTLFRG